jgi:hypothetical protein
MVLGLIYNIIFTFGNVFLTCPDTLKWVARRLSEFKNVYHRKSHDFYFKEMTITVTLKDCVNYIL